MIDDNCMAQPSPEDLLEIYQELLRCSDRMLRRAMEKRWSELLIEEVEFVTSCDRISCIEPTIVYSVEQHSQRQKLVNAIRARGQQTTMMLLSGKAELARQVRSGGAGTCERAADNDAWNSSVEVYPLVH